jgi:2-polyprenyl-6-methoxyphenol hydroxylase-like FAD-dependent oxidoreductase
MSAVECDVLVAGAGPVGMTLALELAHQGVSVVLVEQNRATTPFPKMEVINGRTLEFFQRHAKGPSGGSSSIVDAIRAHGNSADDPFVKQFTTPSGDRLLGEWVWPSVNEQKAQNQQRNDGSAPLEPYCRLSQYIMEPLLMKLCREQPLITLRIGDRFQAFEERPGGGGGGRSSSAGTVVSTVQDNSPFLDGEVGVGEAHGGAKTRITSRFLVGCEGPGSMVRAQLARETGGYALAGPGRLAREGKGTLLLHFVDEGRVIARRWGKFWHHVRMCAGGNLYVISQQHDEGIYTVHVSPGIARFMGVGKEEARLLFAMEPSALADAAAARFLSQAFNGGAPMPMAVRVLVRSIWSPSLLVADRYSNCDHGDGLPAGSGRVFLAGDAVHQVGR